MLKKDLKPLFFDVEKVVLSEHLPGFKFANDLTHGIVAHTPDGKKLINVCSKNYSLISNEELIMPLAEKLEQNHKVSAKVVNDGFSKFYVDFTIKDSAIEVIKKDMIFPRIRLNNSYDGKVKFLLHFGFYRVVCDNGLMVLDKGLSRDIKLMHTPRSFGASALDKTMEAVEVFLEAAPKVASQYKDLAKRKITWEAAELKIKDILENTKYPKKAVEAAMSRLKTESEQFPLSDYLLYNALNFGLYQSNVSAMKVHKMDKVDNQVLKLISK